MTRWHLDSPSVSVSVRAKCGLQVHSSFPAPICCGLLIWTRLPWRTSQLSDMVLCSTGVCAALVYTWQESLSVSVISGSAAAYSTFQQGASPRWRHSVPQLRRLPAVCELPWSRYPVHTSTVYGNLPRTSIILQFSLKQSCLLRGERLPLILKLNVPHILTFKFSWVSAMKNLFLVWSGRLDYTKKAFFLLVPLSAYGLTA